MKRKLPDFLATQKWIRRRAEVWVCNIRLDILAQSAQMVEGCLFYLMGETKLCIIAPRRSRLSIPYCKDVFGANLAVEYGPNAGRIQPGKSNIRAHVFSFEI